MGRMWCFQGGWEARGFPEGTLVTDMASAARRGVVTGLGVLSSIGSDPETFWQALLAGKTGIKRIGLFDPSELPCQIAGEMTDFDAKNFIDKKDRKQLRVMARTIQLAVACAQAAITHSKVDKKAIDLTRFSVIFGAGMVAMELPETADAAAVSKTPERGKIDLKVWGTRGLEVIQPLWMLRYLPNMLACQVSILHDAQGPNNTITQDDVAGLLALGEAMRIMRRDHADFFLVGGAESRVNPLSMTRQSLFLPLSTHNADPATACRPFDAGRTGLVLGEGSGILAVEEVGHAQKRGAEIYADVCGFGAAFNGKDQSDAIERSIRIAMAQAGIGPDDVDHVNASGMGVEKEDRFEAMGIAAAFRDRKDPIEVTSIKAHVGHLGGSSATVELAAVALALRHGMVPATLNHTATDPSCPVKVLTGQPRPLSRRYVVKTSFTSEGQCAAAVLGRHQG
jgi:3-oxoacyl-[acyl-carrier-protein] synthase II